MVLVAEWREDHGKEWGFGCTFEYKTHQRRKCNRCDYSCEEISKE